MFGMTKILVMLSKKMDFKIILSNLKKIKTQ